MHPCRTSVMSSIYPIFNRIFSQALVPDKSSQVLPFRRHTLAKQVHRNKNTEKKTVFSYLRLKNNLFVFNLSKEITILPLNLLFRIFGFLHYTRSSRRTKNTLSEGTFGTEIVVSYPLYQRCTHFSISTSQCQQAGLGSKLVRE